MTTLASLSSQPMMDEHDDFFETVDRSNFPNTEDKARPWQDLDLGWTENWEPYRWTIRAAGKACQPIYVTVAHFFSNMTGSLCPQVTDLLVEWNKAVEGSMAILHEHERNEIIKFHGPSELEKDLRQKLHLQAKGKLREMLSKINPFFDALQNLLLLCTAILPTKSLSLALVSGGAWLVVKKYAEYDEAAQKIIAALNKFRTQLVLFKNVSDQLEGKLCREALLHVFEALISFWAESVSVVRRLAGPVQLESMTILDERVKAANGRMVEAVNNLEMLQKSTGATSDSVAKAQSKVLEQSPDGDLSQAIFPCHEIDLQNKDFLGRSEELRTIYDALDQRAACSLCTVIISGGGGVGKSALALEAAHQLKNEGKFDAILWVKAEDKNVLRESFTKLALRLRLKDAAEGSDKDRNFMILKNWLDKTPKSWLIIYDNVNDFSLLKEYLPPENGCMIVTTRFYSLSYALHGHATRIPLQKFGAQDSLHLFNRYRKSRNSNVDTTADLDETHELLESIDGLALGIKQMAYYMVSKGLSVSKFREQYAKMAKYVLNRAPLSDDQHSLGTLWKLQFEHIKREQPNTRKLLGILSLAGADGFPRELLELDEPPEEESAGWADFCADPEELENAIDDLTDNALADAENASGQLSVHRITQQAFLYNELGLLDPSDLQGAFDGLLFLLVQRFPRATPSEGLWRHWATCSKYIAHVAALAHAFKKFQKKPRVIKPSVAFVKMMIDATWYLFEIGELNESKELLDIAEEACVDKQSLEYAYLCNTYVNIAVDKNDMEMGRVYSEKAIEIREAQLESTDVDLANTYNNFANTLNNEGKFAEALTHYVMAENILSDVNETKEKVVYSALAELNMARSFALKGDTEKAIALFESSGDFFTKKSHKMFVIGRKDALSALGKLKIAHDLAKDLIPYSMTLSGIHYKLGVAQLETGLLKDAKKNFEASLQLAEIHRREGEIARSARQLAALTLGDAGSPDAEKKEALELSARAKNIKDVQWKVIEKFVTRDATMGEEEEYNWLVAAWYR
ncbi:hypothetical protein Neosp_014142 [[Neocosmospora] mangrovei]